jgi:hypothetical protein
MGLWSRLRGPEPAGAESGRLPGAASASDLPTPPAPSSPAGWRGLPPIQRVLGELTANTQGAEFSESLTTWHSPALTVGELDHGVSPLAPSGVVTGLAETVHNYPAPAPTGPRLAFAQPRSQPRSGDSSLQRAVAEPDHELARARPALNPNPTVIMHEIAADPPATVAQADPPATLGRPSPEPTERPGTGSAELLAPAPAPAPAPPAAAIVEGSASSAGAPAEATRPIASQQRLTVSASAPEAVTGTTASPVRSAGSLGSAAPLVLSRGQLAVLPPSAAATVSRPAPTSPVEASSPTGTGFTEAAFTETAFTETAAVTGAAAAPPALQVDHPSAERAESAPTAPVVSRIVTPDAEAAPLLPSSPLLPADPDPSARPRRLGLGAPLTGPPAISPPQVSRLVRPDPPSSTAAMTSARTPAVQLTPATHVTPAVPPAVQLTPAVDHPGPSAPSASSAPTPPVEPTLPASDSTDAAQSFPSSTAPLVSRLSSADTSGAQAPTAPFVTAGPPSVQRRQPWTDPGRDANPDRGADGGLDPDPPERREPPASDWFTHSPLGGAPLLGGRPAPAAIPIVPVQTFIETEAGPAPVPIRWQTSETPPDPVASRPQTGPSAGPRFGAPILDQVQRLNTGAGPAAGTIAQPTRPATTASGTRPTAEAASWPGAQTNAGSSLDAGAVAVAAGIAQRQSDGSVVFDSPAVQTLPAHASQTAHSLPSAQTRPTVQTVPGTTNLPLVPSLAVQTTPQTWDYPTQPVTSTTATVSREAAPAGPEQSGSTAPGSADPAAAPALPGPSAPAAPAVPAAASPGAAAMPSTDELVRRLFDPLAARLKSELRLDRERAGFVTDLKR